MKLSSNALFDLGRVLGLNYPKTNDNLFDVPAVLQPITRLLNPMDTLSSPPATAVNSTFALLIVVNVNAASGAISQAVATLNRGLWRFNVQASYASDYQSNSVPIFENWVELDYPSAGSIPLLGFNANGAAAQFCVQNVVREIEIAIPVDGATIRRMAIQNAAGQHSNASYSLIATKLL